MKTFVFLVTLSLTLTLVKGQNYQITFTGSGASTTVDSVVVQNLVQGTLLTLIGSDILLLTGTSGTDQVYYHKDFRIFPNPMLESAVLDLYSGEPALVTVTIRDIRGVMVAECTTKMARGTNVFEITGLTQGVYLVEVGGEKIHATRKLICHQDIPSVPTIRCTTTGLPEEPEFRASKTIVPMAYNAGEMLLFKAYSGNYATVSTLVPASSQTLNSNFISCTDADGNNYAVVTIGSQIWMAENLNTTKYNDGTDIPYVPDSATWHNLSVGSDPGFCWYNNDPATYAATYGALYNWFAVTPTYTLGKNVCPLGWHVPTDDPLNPQFPTDWMTLMFYIDQSHGAWLKETGNTHWLSPNAGATNQFGFSALPGGMRSLDAFSNMNIAGFWWSVTEGNPTSSFHVNLHYNYTTLSNGGDYKSTGMSVRCKKD